MFEAEQPEQPQTIQSQPPAAAEGAASAGVVPVSPAAPESASPAAAPANVDAGGAQPEQTPAVPAPVALGQENSKAMAVSGLIEEKDVAQAALLTTQEATQFTGLLQNGGISKENVGEFLQLSAAERQERYQREAIIDMLLKDGVFGNEDLEELRMQPAAELKYYFNFAQTEDDKGNATLEGFHPSDSEVPHVDVARNKDLSADPIVAKEMLKWTGKGGILDQSISKIEEQILREQFDQELQTEAEAFWNGRGQTDPAELQRRKLDGLMEDDKKAEFIAAFVAQRSSDPEYQNELEAKIKAQVEERVDIIRGLVLIGQPENAADPAAAEVQKGLWKKLKESSPALSEMLLAQLLKTGSEVTAALLDNDFGSFMRALLLVNGGFSRDRSSFSNVDAQGNKIIGLDQFGEVAKKPERFGKAMAEAYEEKEFVEAGFRINQEVLEAAKKGDPAAVRELMKSYLKDLFASGDTTDKVELRWEVAKKIVPEAMYSGKRVVFDDKMKEHLETMHRSVLVKDGLFDQTFPAAEVASGSEPVEAEPGRDTSDIQPLPVSTATPLPRAA